MSTMSLQGAFLLVLFQLSHILEDMATQRATVNLQLLFDDMPHTALLVATADVAQRTKPDDLDGGKAE